MTEKKEAKKETKKTKETKVQIQKTEKTAAPAGNNALRIVLITEKAVQLIETQNKLVFIVDRTSNKREIARAAEQSFGSKISKVTTTVDQRGRKKAYIKFMKEGEAGEIAIRLGII